MWLGSKNRRNGANVATKRLDLTDLRIELKTCCFSSERVTIQCKNQLFFLLINYSFFQTRSLLSILLSYIIVADVIRIDRCCGFCFN